MPLCFIVEDHGDTREGYAEYLSWSGIDVRSATGGEELRKLLETEVPDAVVMDLRLPSIDGWTLTRELKQDPRTAKALVIVVSASVLSDDVRRAQEAGCDAFLPKPCDPARLVAALQRLLDRPSTREV
jgi:CheY-like chemotaxis protein